MAKVVRTNFAPIFSDFANFLGIGALIIAPPGDDFSSLLPHWQETSMKRCKRRQNRPRKANATSY